MRREEGAYEQHVDRQTCRAADKGVDEDSDDAARPALDGTCGHDGGHRAAETHHQRDERLAVQAEPVHDLVHDECRARHIA